MESGATGYFQDAHGLNFVWVTLAERETFLCSSLLTTCRYAYRLRSSFLEIW